MKMSAVILCGGRSRRMGTDKARLVIEGAPAAARLFGALSLDRELFGDVWLSVGEGESYPEISARKISDRFSDCGPMGGLEAALTVCREGLLFVTPVDMPFADAALAKELQDIMLKTDLGRNADAVLVTDGAGRIQPLLGIYRKDVRELLTKRLLRSAENAGLLRMRDFLAELSVLYVPAEELTDGILKTRSCNTPEEFAELLGKTEEGRNLFSGTAPETVKPVVLSVTGWSGTGKTTWIEKLIPELAARGIRTAVIKHDAHNFDVDKEGKDTWRFARAGAAVTGIVSGTKAALMEYRHVELSQFLDRVGDVELLILEGGSRTDLSKILVYREALGKGMRVPAEDCIAVISDDQVTKTEGKNCDSFNCFGFAETGRTADFLAEWIRRKV